MMERIIFLKPKRHGKQHYAVDIALDGFYSGFSGVSTTPTKAISAAKRKLRKLGRLK